MIIKGKAKTLIIVAVVICSLTLGGYSVFAATAKSTTSQYPTIVEKIAKAFNLNAAEVNKVFEADKKEMEAKRQAQYKERLDQAVEDGTITRAQKEAILDKSAEMKTKLEALKNLSLEERKAKMDALRTELQTWAKKNGLDQKQYLLEMGGPGGGPGNRGGFGHRPGMDGSRPGGPPPGMGGMPPSYPTTSQSNF